MYVFQLVGINMSAFDTEELEKRDTAKSSPKDSAGQGTADTSVMTLCS